MDGSSISGKVASILQPIKTEKLKEMKSQQSDSERDADGKRYKENSPNKQLTDEEVQEAIKIIKALPGFIKNNLKLRLEKKSSVYVVYIEDQFSKVIRRIEESELCQLLEKSPDKKGKIFSRSA